MKLNNALKIDIVVLVFLLLISPVIVLHLNLSFLHSTFLYFLTPSIYLLIRKPRAIHETLGAALLIGGVLGTWAEVIAEVNKAWIWPSPNFLTSFSFLGLVPLDIIVWLIVWVFQIIVFYEHFFKHRHKGGFSPRWTKGLFSAAIVLITTSIIYLLNPKLLNLPFSYLILGGAALLISGYILIRRPEYIKDFFLLSLYFIPLYSIFEYTSLRLNHWSFPAGNHLAYFSYGGFSIAFEEFFFWVILSTTIILCYYKWWVDDDKREI